MYYVAAPDLVNLVSDADRSAAAQNELLVLNKVLVPRHLTARSDGEPAHVEP